MSSLYRFRNCRCILVFGLFQRDRRENREALVETKIGNLGTEIIIPGVIY